MGPSSVLLCLHPRFHRSQTRRALGKVSTGDGLTFDFKIVQLVLRWLTGSLRAKIRAWKMDYFQRRCFEKPTGVVAVCLSDDQLRHTGQDQLAPLEVFLFQQLNPILPSLLVSKSNHSLILFFTHEFQIQCQIYVFIYIKSVSPVSSVSCPQRGNPRCLGATLLSLRLSWIWN